MVEGRFYNKIDASDTVECFLCPHHCKIRPDHLGICGVRKNVNGELKAISYGRLSAIHADPIEKKPLYHFYPGSVVLSLGGYGCNMRCSFCQNCDISQVKLSNYENYSYHSPDSILEKTKRTYNNVGVAYTYNEPSIWYEYMYDVAKLCSTEGFKNIMITNGYIERNPLLQILPFMDAFNVDLKAFSNDFYHQVTGSSLYPVQKTLEIVKSNDKHLEITNLVVPELNDDVHRFQKMVKWIADNLGKDTVLHLSRYFPMHRLDKEATPPKILLDFYDIAREELWYVYLGNLRTDKGSDTYCHNCGDKLIHRSGYYTEIVSPLINNECQHCGTKIPVIQEI